MRKTTKLAALIGAAAITTPISATSAGLVGGTAPAGSGASVSGHSVTRPGGILATRAQVQADNTWVAQTVGNAVQQVGKALADGQSKQIEATSKLLDQMVQNIEMMFREQFKARRASKRQEQFGTLSRPTGACGSPALGRGIGQGDANQAGLSGRIAASQSAHDTSVSRDGDTRERLVDLTDEEKSADALIPESGSIEDKDQALEFLNTALNPRPEVKLDESIKSTGAGERYTAAKNVSDTRRSLANKVGREVMLNYTPSLPLGEWATQAWSDAGHDDPPESVVEGHISPMALNELTVSLRSGNEEWYKKVNGAMNQTGLLRELVTMKAQSMRMQYQSLRLQNQISALLSMNVAASQQGRENDELNQLRNAAVTAGGG